MTGGVPNDWRKTNIALICKKRQKDGLGSINFALVGSCWGSEQAAAWINENGVNDGKLCLIKPDCCCQRASGAAGKGELWMALILIHPDFTVLLTPPPTAFYTI